MSKKSNYISTNRSKHYLKCHLIFVCKYRKPMLIGQLNDDIKKMNQQKYSGTMTIGGKVYRVEVVNGERYVEGMPVEAFLKTLSLNDLYRARQRKQLHL